MESYEVRAASAAYPVYFGQDFSGLAAAVECAGLSGRKAVIVTDSNVAELYGQDVEKALGGVLSVGEAFVFPAGEESKTLETISNMYAHFLAEKLDRKSVVVALGGGVVGDMAGFAAATYMRGVPFIQIPTTLLSQVDSSVGGKTGVDFVGMKNLIGAFNQPEFVVINTETLRTLPPDQVVSGMGEVVKHGLILDAAYFAYLLDNADGIDVLAADVMGEVVRGSCRIKAGVVARDERESGLREILNYGHTFGHAVESCYDFKLPHGHCVALGMVCAMRFAVRAGMFMEVDKQAAEAAFARFGLPVRLPDDMPKAAPDTVLAAMLSDKKTKGGKLSLILPTGIGAVERVATDDMAAVKRALLEIYGEEGTI